MCKVEYIDNKIYIACSTLSEGYGVADDTIRQWSKRKIGERIYLYNIAYINYDDIPTPTRSKLPSKDEFIAIYRSKQTDAITDQYFNQMESAYLKGFIKYRDIYTSLVKPDEVTGYAQKHAVWEVILRLHSQKTSRIRQVSFRSIWEAYRRIYPNGYAYNRMNPAINKAKSEGIPALIVKQSGGHNRLDDPVLDKWILDALSSGKAYSQYYIYQLITELCKQYNHYTPSITWVKKRCNTLQPIVFDKTFGTDKGTYTKLPYTGILRAENPNSQWQIDGYTLPFYMEDFEKLTLFVVKDAFSGRIVGYEIAGSENTETILKGIENAVNNTGCLPFEIVSDNHSFNKTKEAEYFKEAIARIGTTWTVSENPRYKSIVERGFKTFAEKFLKNEYGYIGEGIKTRNPKGRTSQDLFDKYYAKKSGYLTEEQIKLIGIRCVEAFNNHAGKDSKSPVMKYNGTEQPYSFKVDKINSLCLFVRANEKTIRRGQINIERSGVRYEYQLNAELYGMYNDKKVKVRYTDFDEIHLFDLKTDQYIGSVGRKQYAHGAKADQTEEDIKILTRHSGRLKGIKTRHKQRQIEIAKEAARIDPEAAYAMNAKLTPKDIIREFEQNGALREQAERLGVNLDTVPNITVFSEVQTERHDTKRNKRRESPFTPKQHTITRISMEDINTED